MIYGQYTLGMNVPRASSPADMRDNLKSKAPTKRRSRAIAAEDGTLTDRAYRELEEMIVTLRLSPGTVVSEQALAGRLKICRTPNREERARPCALRSAGPQSGRGCSGSPETGLS